MIKSILKSQLLKFLFLIALAHSSFASEINESVVQPKVDWELIIPHEILQGTQCTISEEERLFIESFFS